MRLLSSLDSPASTDPDGRVTSNDRNRSLLVSALHRAAMFPVMKSRALTRADGVATIDLRDHELDATEASTLFDVLALPDLERVVIEIHDRRSLGAPASVLLRGLEA